MRCTTMRPHPRCAQSLWTTPSRLPLSSIRFQSSSTPTSTLNDRPFPPRRSRSHSKRRQPARQFESRQVELPVDSLGEPGSVTVISSSRPPLPRTRKPRMTRQNTKSTRVNSILDDLEQEASVQDENDIFNVIDSLDRSAQHGSRSTLQEWDTIRSDLATSFTYKQLSDYVAARKQSASEIHNGENAWRPGTSSFWQASLGGQSNTERATTAQGLTGKPLLAEQILRDCWHFSVASEVGQLDLRLPPLSMTVLLNSMHFSFDEVAELHNSSIDVTSSLGLVRVTGEQEACESIRDVIQDAVARIREKDAAISLSVGNTINPAQVFTRPFIDWICQTYSVAIEQDASSTPTKILYLAEGFLAAEDARRTLNQALYEAIQPPIPFSTYMSASEPANLYSQTLEHPSWMDRSKAWFRWALSSSQTTSTETERTPFFDGHQTRLSDHLLKLLRKDSAMIKSEPPNSSRVTLHETVTASIGRCLFSSKQEPTDADATLSASQLGRSSMTRTFTTEVPNLTPFLESLSHPKSKSGTGSLLLKPSSEFLGLTPELEVEYRLHQSEGEDSSLNVEVTSLKSILETSSVDYLLPENSIDLRFKRSVHRNVTNEILGESPHYRQFIRNIEQSLARDISFASSSADSWQPTALPPFCKVSLPRGLLLSPEEEALGDSLWDPLLENNLEVEYMYPPLRDVLSPTVQYYDLGGRELSYRFYESGPFLAGRTTEVALAVDIPQVNTNLKHELDEEEFQRSVEQKYHEFYTAACDMAFKVKSGNRGVETETETNTNTNTEQGHDNP